MAALFQLLGQLGTGYAQARDTQTEEGNKLAQVKAALQERLAQQQSMEAYRTSSLKLRDFLAQQKANGPGQKFAISRDDKTGEYSASFMNEMGKVTKVPFGPGVTPESEARTEDTQSEIGKRQAASQKAITDRQEAHDKRLGSQKETDLRLAAQLREKLQAYKAAHPIAKATTAKESAAIQLRERQARWVIAQGRTLLSAIEDPEINDAIGPLAGFGTWASLQSGTASKKVANFAAALESFINLQPALHGSRGRGMVEEFKKAIPAWYRSNPDALAGAIESLMTTSTNFLADDVAKIDPAAGQLLIDDIGAVQPQTGDDLKIPYQGGGTPVPAVPKGFHPIN